MRCHVHHPCRCLRQWDGGGCRFKEVYISSQGLGMQGSGLARRRAILGLPGMTRHHDGAGGVGAVAEVAALERASRPNGGGVWC